MRVHACRMARDAVHVAGVHLDAGDEEVRTMLLEQLERPRRSRRLADHPNAGAFEHAFHRLQPKGQPVQEDGCLSTINHERAAFRFGIPPHHPTNWGDWTLIEGVENNKRFVEKPTRTHPPTGGGPDGGKSRRSGRGEAPADAIASSVRLTAGRCRRRCSRPPPPGRTRARERSPQGRDARAPRTSRRSGAACVRRRARRRRRRERVPSRGSRRRRRGS